MFLLEWRRQLSRRGVIVARMWIDDAFLQGRGSLSDRASLDSEGYVYARAVIVAGHRLLPGGSFEYLVRAGLGSDWAQSGYMWIPERAARRRFLEGFGMA
jgi:hypothetical protein